MQKLILLLLMVVLMAEAQNYPVVVTPGTPSIWSMEQAHYLLNRLRANNDAIRTKAPGETDLDANAINAIRIDAIQQTFNASAAVNSQAGQKNKITLQQFQDTAARRADLVKQADVLRARLYADQFTLADLQGQKARLTAIKTANDAITPALAAGTPTPPATIALNRSLADLEGRITTLTQQNTATQKQIDTLDAQAGTAAGPPALEKVDAPATLGAPDKLLKDAFTKLFSKMVDGFDRPKLQASIVLDNFLQMQYEIVAKQLTSLRDEAGAGQRIIFMEMPTSITAADARLILRGGEKKLAQSWWRVREIYRRYKIEESPCWLGDQYNERYRYGVQLPSSIDSVSRNDTWRRLKTPAPRLDSSPPSTAEMETQYQKLAELIDKLRGSLDDVDIQASWNILRTIQDDLRTARHTFRSGEEVFLRSLPEVDPFDPGSPQPKLEYYESSCRVKRNDFAVASARFDEFRELVAKAARNANTKEQRKKAEDLQELAKKIGEVREDQLADSLAYYQAEIYQFFGGPKQLHSAAFVQKISDDDAAVNFRQGSGEARAVELIPRQTALNVNSGHALINNSALSFVWNTLFSFGLKVDYQRQHEHYDQFIQQETFASGFGKGRATFGWTFGPLPGSKVLNSGTRNTYAVLTVPDDATALAIEGTGCAFHRKEAPPNSAPFQGEGAEKFHCTNRLSTVVGVPDRMNSGGFWITDLEYQAVDAGQQLSLVLRGSYFSPQTTVLVNGRRIPQVLGLGKPLQAMDQGGLDGQAGDGVITGTFEYVNQEHMAVSLVIPKGYDGPDFPVITLVAPSRAMAINSLPLRINGRFSRLKDENIIRPAPPRFSLSGWQFFGVFHGVVTAHLTGQVLTDLDQVRLNGEPCETPEVLSGSLARVACPVSSEPEWEFLAMTGDADTKKRKTSRLPVHNPRLISITGFEVLDGIEYGDDLHPTSYSVKLTGSGFTPRTTLVDNPQVDPKRLTLAYIGPTELLCVVRQPKNPEVIMVEEADTGQTPATALIPVPKDKQKDKPNEDTAGQITVTTVQSEKKVVKK